jgi:hypothetical protein
MFPQIKLNDIEKKVIKSFEFKKHKARIQFEDDSYILINHDMYDGMEYLYEGKEVNGLTYIDITE